MGWPGLLLMLLLWAGVIALILWGVSGLFPAGPLSNEAGYLMTNLRAGQIPAGATTATVLTDTCCEPDADGVSHCSGWFPGILQIPTAAVLILIVWQLMLDIARSNFAPSGRAWATFAPYAAVVAVLGVINIVLFVLPMTMRM
jgi:hypothetical protein